MTVDLLSMKMWLLDKDVKALYKCKQFPYPERQAGLLDLPKRQKQ